jgi:ferric-chelate reductase
MLTILFPGSIMAASISRVRKGSLGILTIAALLMACSGFTIGLTFAPCYSTLCVERWFPSQACIHIAVFYGGIAIVAIYLSAWSKSKAVKSVSDRYLFDTALPLVGLRLSIGGIFLSAWILAFTLVTTAYWFPAEHPFWHAKGIEADWTQYIFRVTWSGVTGHWCDIMFGLVFLPVGRDSLISNAFGVQPSALLLAHKLLAYSSCAFGLIRGLLYYVSAQ